MRKFRKTAAVVAAAALALSLCACGGKTDKATTEQTSGGSATVTDATASTIEEMETGQRRNRKLWRMTVSRRWKAQMRSA